jgi:hypothetical protein
MSRCTKCQRTLAIPYRNSEFCRDCWQPRGFRRCKFDNCPDYARLPSGADGVSASRRCLVSARPIAGQLSAPEASSS